VASTSDFHASKLAVDLAQNSLRPSRSPAPGMIRLQVGDPDFATPEHIVKAMFEAVEAGLTHYANWEGDPELRAAIAREVSGLANRDIPINQVVITHGATAGIAASFLAAVEPGQRVLIPEPSYSFYADATRMARAEPVMVPPAPGFRLDLDALTAAAPGARMVVICNPCNPTGVVHTRAELESVVEIAERNDLLVVSDEAYSSIVFTGAEFVSALELPALHDRLIYLQTFSKKYAMTGFRIGYIVAPPAIAAAALTVHRMMTGAVNTFVQRAALTALTQPTDDPERMRREYELRRDLVAEILHGAPGLQMAAPEGAFYAFPFSTEGVRSDQLMARAYEKGVAVRSGREFGPSGEGAIRVSFATDRESLTEGLDRLRDIFTR
jgi:aspartate/methionine/tyrosine aminotransferase